MIGDGAVPSTASLRNSGGRSLPRKESRRAMQDCGASEITASGNQQRGLCDWVFLGLNAQLLGESVDKLSIIRLHFYSVSIRNSCAMWCARKE